LNLQRKILLVVGLAVILLSAGLYLTLRFAVLAGFEHLEHRIAHRTMGRVIRALKEDLKDGAGGIHEDPEKIAALSEQTHAAVTLLTKPSLESPEATIWNRLLSADTSQTLIDSGDGKNLIGYHLFRDSNGQPLAVVKVVFPREIFDMARTSVNLMIWLVIGVALMLGMIALALVRQLILVNLIQSLTSLNTGIYRIAKDGNPARRVKPAGGDEMSELAEGINRMLETLEQAQTRLRESENRYRSLVESAPDAIFTLDAQGRIQSMNSTTAGLLNPTEENPAPATVEGLFPLDAAAVLQPALARIWAGGEPVASLEGRRHIAGEDRWFAISLTPVRHEGTLLHVLGIARDITERVLAERHTQEQQQQLIQAHKLMALGTLVSGVAHEINNPNNVIMLNTPMIRRTLDRLVPQLEARTREHPDEGLDPELITSLPDMLRGIEDASRRIQKIVESLKDFARPNPTRLNEPVDLKSALEAVLQLLDHPLHRATHHFQWTCPDSLPLLTGNKQRLEQVFINLLQNACQALPDPECQITLTVEAPTRPDQPIRVLIRDEGIGIPPDHLPLLTTPFFTTQRARGGTGLGLSISLGILKEHGGDLAFESQPGVGTTVIVTLPPRRDSNIETPTRPVHNSSSQGP
jgi:PAS domain S-box-containing protein